MATKIQITVLYFAQVREITRVSKEVLEMDELSSASDLLALLESLYPKIKDVNHLSISVNCLASKPDTILVDSDEVALLPPISGGWKYAGHFK